MGCYKFVSKYKPRIKIGNISIKGSKDLTYDYDHIDVRKPMSRGDRSSKKFFGFMLKFKW